MVGGGEGESGSGVRSSTRWGLNVFPHTAATLWLSAGNVRWRRARETRRNRPFTGLSIWTLLSADTVWSSRVIVVLVTKENYLINLNSNYPFPAG